MRYIGGHPCASCDAYVFVPSLQLVRYQDFELLAVEYGKTSTILHGVGFTLGVAGYVVHTQPNVHMSLEAGPDLKHAGKSAQKHLVLNAQRWDRHALGSRGALPFLTHSPVSYLAYYRGQPLYTALAVRMSKGKLLARDHGIQKCVCAKLIAPNTTVA